MSKALVCHRACLQQAAQLANPYAAQPCMCITCLAVERMLLEVQFNVLSTSGVYDVTGQACRQLMPPAGKHALSAAAQTASMLLSGKAAPLSAVSATCELHSWLTSQNIASAACWQIPAHSCVNRLPLCQLCQTLCMSLAVDTLMM